MTTDEYLHEGFAYGYDSGRILSRVPDRTRRREQRLIGGSYRSFFKKAVQPFLREDSIVLELGPGRGSWTRALLECLPGGQVHTLDFVDVSTFLRPEQYGNRLVCHRVEDNSFDAVDGVVFDFFFSFGVLCHNKSSEILEVMRNARPCMRSGAVAVHQYGDWKKLDQLGWAERFGVPAGYRDLPDDHEANWWPRNDQDTMAKICAESGWIVEQADLGLFNRDSVIMLRTPHVE